MKSQRRRQRATTLIGLALAIGLGGCKAVPLAPGAEKVIVSRQAAPEGCKFVGAVVGEQGGMVSGQLTSNKNLAQGALNDIRNKALQLGANYVSLESVSAGTTSRGSFYEGTGSVSAAQTDVTKTGNAYHCHPEAIGLK
ncbi:MAG: DUF4156 domain-containing protein [Myxococcota bacterium]